MYKNKARHWDNWFKIDVSFLANSSLLAKIGTLYSPMLLLEALWLVLTIHFSVDSKNFTSPPCLCKVTGFICTEVERAGESVETHKLMNICAELINWWMFVLMESVTLTSVTANVLAAVNLQAHFFKFHGHLAVWICVMLQHWTSSIFVQTLIGEFNTEFMARGVTPCFSLLLNLPDQLFEYHDSKHCKVKVEEAFFLY